MFFLNWEEVIDPNQNKETGLEISSRAIYVNKDFEADFEKAVSEGKWITVTAVTPSTYRELVSKVSIRVKEIEKEKEKKYVGKYIIACDLAECDTGKCSCYNVYFLITKNPMEEDE